MKRIISIILAAALLCTSAYALGIEDFPGFSTGVFDSQEMKESTADFLAHLKEFSQEVKSMDDAELESYIRFSAEKYDIPDMNQEQIDFLKRLARGLETAEKVGETVKDYQETAENLGETAEEITETASGLAGVLNSLLDTLNGLLDKLQGILGSGAE